MLVYAVSREPRLAGMLAAIGALGAVLLLWVVLRGVVELLAWALGLLGVVYAIAVAVHAGAVDEGAPLVGTALLLCGELAAWSLDARWRMASDGPAGGRGIALGALALASLAAAALVVGVAAAPPGRGLAWTTLGAAAAVGAVGAAVAVLRRAEQGS